RSRHPLWQSLFCAPAWTMERSACFKYCRVVMPPAGLFYLRYLPKFLPCRHFPAVCHVFARRPRWKIPCWPWQQSEPQTGLDPTISCSVRHKELVRSCFKVQIILVDVELMTSHRSYELFPTNEECADSHGTRTRSAFRDPGRFHSVRPGAPWCRRLPPSHL